jgi:hypothetical protein
MTMTDETTEAACPRCDGSGVFTLESAEDAPEDERFSCSDGCKACGGTGRVTADQWNAWVDYLDSLVVPETGPIKIALVRTNCFTRRACSVCGDQTEKVDVLAEGPGGLLVCEHCLRSGDIDERLERFAGDLECGQENACAYRTAQGADL